MTKSQAFVIIEAAKHEGVKLSEWEMAFISNLKRMKEMQVLSDKQRAIVERIYERATGFSEKVYREKI